MKFEIMCTYYAFVAMMKREKGTYLCEENLRYIEICYCIDIA